MARYDTWQNCSLIAVADTLTDAERWQDRGTFFRSIAETLNHILWDHHIWLAHQRGDEATDREIGARHPYSARHATRRSTSASGRRWTMNSTPRAMV